MQMRKFRKVILETDKIFYFLFQLKENQKYIVRLIIFFHHEL